MVVTPSNFAGSSVIGVALLNVFGSNADHAAYVFTDVGYKQTAKTMGEAASHEAGHTFGLSHDGGPASPSYYDGHGAWAPIMGRPIDPARPVSQWSRAGVLGCQQLRGRSGDHRRRALRSQRRPFDAWSRVSPRRSRQHRVGADGRGEQRRGIGQHRTHRRPRRLRRRRHERHAVVAAAPADGAGELVEPGRVAHDPQQRRCGRCVGRARRAFRLGGRPGAVGTDGEVHDRGGAGGLAHRVHRVHDLRVARCLRAGDQRPARYRRIGARDLGVHPGHTDEARRHSKWRRCPEQSRWRTSGGRAGRRRGRGSRRRDRRGGQRRSCQPVGAGVRHGLPVLGKRAQHLHAQLRGRPDGGEHHRRCVVVGGATVCVDVFRDRHPRRHHWLAEPERDVTIDADRADTGYRHPVGRRWGEAPCRSDPGGRFQRGCAGRVDCGRRQRHGGQRSGARIPHGLPVQWSTAEHLDGELRRQRGATEQHDRRVVRRPDLHLQRRRHRRARRSARIVRRRRPGLSAHAAGASARHQTVRNARCRRGGRLQRERSQPRRAGAGRRLRQRHGRQPRCAPAM